MENNDSGYLLQHLYASLEQETYNPENIDRIVKIGMEGIRENCARKEEQFVEQMLWENPITIERRSNTTVISANSINTSYQKHSDEEVDVVSLTDTSKKDSNSILQQQRAEACRRSRYNNKIKKAKSKYRHTFMAEKLLHSTQLLNCIQDFIQQAENKLLTEGLTKDKLQHLRHSFGVDRAVNIARNCNVL